MAVGRRKANGESDCLTQTPLDAMEDPVDDAAPEVAPERTPSRWISGTDEEVRDA